jgi:electron transport complex protein RnfB
MSVTAILLSVAILGGVGLTFAGLIALTHRKFKVWEDPRIDAVNDMLPGANCGACGQAGCRAFAEGVVGGKLQPAGCTVLSADGVVELAQFLGVEAGEASKRVARLLCAGGTNVAIQQADYIGLKTCKAAAAVAGGGKGCAWGCLGLADCEVVCDFDVHERLRASRRHPRQVHGVRRLRGCLSKGPVHADAPRAPTHRAVQECA